MRTRPPQVWLRSCGVLGNTGTAYVLRNDISAPGTCFGVQADNITLNLNGHTITYATAPQTIPTYGIVGEACWDFAYVAPNPCGGTSFNKLTVYGGTVTQGPGAAPFSHGIRLGQGPGNGLTVHDTTFNVSADASIPVYTTYEGTNATVYDNTFNNNVTVIQNRHQIQGASIKFADSSQVLGPATIHGNHISGGAQGGIFSAVPRTTIYDNVVSQKGTYTNDFGIYAWADKGQVYNNTVTPIQGRGIQIALGVGQVVHDNNIIVIEQSNNLEYGGCQMGGTYGIQFDDNPQEAEAYHNAVVAKADQCMAQALRVTDSRTPSNLSHDNSYTAQRVGASAAIAAGFGTGGASGFTSQNDTFVADTANVYFDWDGGRNLTFLNATFVKGPDAVPNYVTFSFRNGGPHPIMNIHVVDPVFQNGAAKDSTDMMAVDLSNWPGPGEYFIDWTYTLTVKDLLMGNLSGATVTITDALKNQVFSGIANTNGQITTVLNEFHMFNTTSAVVKEMHTPDTVSVSKTGCTPNPDSAQVTVNRTTTQTIQLTCRQGRVSP